MPPDGTKQEKLAPEEARAMNLTSSVRSFWSGARRIFGGPQKTTVVICPTAELPAMVALDPVQGVESCSRWPEFEQCTQRCMAQVQFSADDLQEFLERYEGRNCASCGAVLTAGDWYNSRMAAVEAETATPEIPRANGGSFSEYGAPICSSCFRAK